MRKGIYCNRGEGRVKDFDWPKTEHGIYVDKDDNVWIEKCPDRSSSLEV